MPVAFHPSRPRLIAPHFWSFSAQRGALKTQLAALGLAQHAGEVAASAAGEMPGRFGRYDGQSDGCVDRSVIDPCIMEVIVP